MQLIRHMPAQIRQHVHGVAMGVQGVHIVEDQHHVFSQAPRNPAADGRRCGRIAGPGGRRNFTRGHYRVVLQHRDQSAEQQVGVALMILVWHPSGGAAGRPARDRGGLTPACCPDHQGDPVFRRPIQQRVN